MKFIPNKEKLIQQIETLQQFLQKGNSLENCTFQNVNFRNIGINWDALKFKNTTFLGCHLTMEEEIKLRLKGAIIYPNPEGLPYNPFRKEFYSWQELMKGFSTDEDKSADYNIYKHFSTNKFNPSINESLWQRIHDHAMDDAMRDFLCFDKNGMTSKKCVGFMGGHSTKRTDPFYAKTAFAAKLLAEDGFLVISGGGPGIMEATNLGAYFANKDNKDLTKAISILEQASHYSDPDFHTQAFEVLELYPEGNENLAIPTWFYGHEPSNLFATHIAKYFSNSIREDTLLAISLYGIICSPGSAGTTQEIFMDATQNHYGTFNYFSPMVFLGKKRYEIDTMIYPLLKQLSYGKKYHDLLFITDEPDEVLNFIKSHPPIKVKID